jgi:hypothetical protein
MLTSPIIGAAAISSDDTGRNGADVSDDNESRARMMKVSSVESAMGKGDQSQHLLALEKMTATDCRRLDAISLSFPRKGVSLKVTGESWGKQETNAASHTQRPERAARRQSFRAVLDSSSIRGKSGKV